ncbi:hypothetical protein [Nocardia sp. NPDC004123]
MAGRIEVLSFLGYPGGIDIGDHEAFRTAHRLDQPGAIGSGDRGAAVMTGRFAL